ncbi:MAG: hypothetical protein CMM80_02455 [Rhodospirillaceae bacterium]|nr:hypothetical protein [Rhodospirillaceae bacterium]|tara:strand:+ start:69 stop:380 length:312 start_codon:yes stop_codon:yes gene_type:complete
MGQVVTLYWRDIPAQVVAEKGRGREREQAKIELHRRFALAIDEAAMRDGANSTDDYLADWRRGEAVECSDDLKSEALKVAERLETEFDSRMLAKLVNTGGRAG